MHLASSLVSSLGAEPTRLTLSSMSAPVGEMLLTTLNMRRLRSFVRRSAPYKAAAVDKMARQFSGGTLIIDPAGTNAHDQISLRQAVARLAS
jgi:hypothetical protein